MPSACFVDTNVMLYLKDPREPQKQAIARSWIAALSERDLIIISPQVMNEFAYNVLRKFPAIATAELTQFLLAMEPWCKAPLTAATCLEGLAIHGRYRYSFFDSTLIAAALAYGCDILLSEDLADGQKIGNLTIINPFETALEAVLAS
ncbi:PIN domain-containing protein [Bosea caraganae]|uniref:PIN domain-containing protein n=3 Tax=Bosea caraganae TaxID=2763117 RepID=A0A370L6U1_9HYPH|nr:PIN domain-containing protein [Bosea caraganae]RDJ25894.1 PIN domain-containing protein [Bosea caraganae]